MEGKNKSPEQLTEPIHPEYVDLTLIFITRASFIRVAFSQFKGSNVIYSIKTLRI
jgi:hypothetical protein